MDPQNSTTTATATATPPIPSSSEPPQLPTPQPQPQSQPQPPSSSASASAPSTSAPIPPSPNPNPKPSTPSLPPQSLPAPAHTRPPPTLNRPWPQPPHYSHHYPSPSSSASSVPPAPSVSGPPPRGGIAIGVPAHHPGPPPPQPTPYTSSYGHFGGIGRGGGVGVPEPSSNSNASQVRPPMPGMQGMGMMGSLGSSSQMRPAGISPHHPQRPVQSPLRPPSTASNQSPTSQNFQGHNLSRGSSLGSPSSPNTSQVLPLHNQPWLSGSQGKPPIPSSPYRQQMTSTSMLQRSHLPQPQQQQQQHHPLPTATQQQQQGPMPTASPQQHMPSVQHQQPSSSHQGHDHFGQQTQPSRIPQASPRQQQNSRVQVPVNQKSSPLAAAQPNTVQSAPQNRITSAETEEPCNRILSKRTIHDLVNQIDPSERLDPDVEDILMDIADEFVESITTFSCSLAKHRKSTTLEAKDILLHLEKNWNITLPGFGGDEIKGYRKPSTNDIHKGRLAAIKKSMVATETANMRSSAGQATGNAKGGVKAPANISSQNIKMREVT
ncbi:transcription initiation factor TFIID subunit 12 [Rosa sericea]